MAWKLQYYGFFSKNYYDIAIPFIFESDKLIIECYRLDPAYPEWIGWITKEIQSGINAQEPPVKFYVDQKRYLNTDNNFPYKLIAKSNNYSINNIHLKIHEWVPLEFMNSQEIQLRNDWMLIFPKRSLRLNWYLENQGENPIVFKWGDGNEWGLEVGQFLSGEKGRNKDLSAKSLLGSQLNFIENWEE